MNWGVELWDQYENVGGHVHKGINFLETYSHFIKDRCQVETEYARSLRRLVKTYSPKKKDDLDLQFSFVRAFRDVLNETGDFAGQHEMIAENLNSSVIQELHVLIREFKDERKKLLAEGSKMQQQLQQSLQQLEKAKKCYEKTFKEAEKAQENYLKADADYNLSRAEVEKQRNNSSYKNQQCEDQKNEYASQLIKTNQLQTSHYSSMMPDIFQQLQDLDEKRTCNFKAFLKKSVEVEHSVFPIINKCLDGVVQAADSINESQDSELVIEKYKSGFTPPMDIPFDDLSAPRQNGDVTPSHPATRSETMKGTISASRLKKRVGIFGIFGGSNKANTSFCEKDDFFDLPPNQRRKKIQGKIAEVTNKLQQENKSREGLEKMKQVYTNNSSLGDPETITGQLSDSTQTIDKLQAELDRYTTMLEDAEREFQARGTASGGPNTPTAAAFGRHAHANGVGASSSPRSSLASQRTSLSDESLSRSASDSSVCANSINSATHPNSTFHAPTSYLSPGASQFGSTPTGHAIPSPASLMVAIPPGKISPAQASHIAKGSVSPAQSTVANSTRSDSPAQVVHASPLSTGLVSASPLAITSTLAINRNPLPAYHSNNSAVATAGSFLHANRFHAPCNSFVSTADTNTSHKKPTVVTTIGSSHSPESGIGLSHNSLHGSDSYDQQDGHEEPEIVYDVETQPVIGTCHAVYPFQATSEGSMGIVEGENLLLLEMDQGDGWSRVRRANVSEEGFVPTAYLQIELHNNC